MTKSTKTNLAIAINANLITALLLAFGPLLPGITQPMALGGAILIWLGLWFVLRFIVKARWSSVKTLGYYFLPTASIFWALDERHRRISTEKEVKRLKGIIDNWPDIRIRIISQFVDPEKQKDSFNELLGQMTISDRRLVLIVDNFRRYMKEMLGSVGDTGNYGLLRQVIEQFALCTPEDYPETYILLLWLLCDIFNMPPVEPFTRQFQKDMTTTLKHVIWRVNDTHLNRLTSIIHKVMTDDQDEHELARSIAETLLVLDWKERRKVCQIIFGQSKRRAFRFPERFGHDFLNILAELKYKVFDLDLQSLRDLIQDALHHNGKGLINLNSELYKNLCSGVFAAIEDPGHKGIHHYRVFRRLVDASGNVKVECTLPDGKSCTCGGKSLSFRGLYSDNCVRKVAERLQTKITPLLDAKREFALTAKIAKLHGEDPNEKGRGIFFEQANEPVAKDLYAYISQH